MTYNIRAGLGLDRVHSLERVAEVIGAAGADVVALQEVDLKRLRSGGVDQPAVLGELTGMNVLHGHSFIDDDGGRYGNAVLARCDAELERHAGLPGPELLEPRSVMRVSLCCDGQRLTLVNTHLGLTRGERRDQVEALVEEGWLEQREGEPLVFCGDLNLGSGGAVHRRLRERLHDVFEDARWPRFNTWPTRCPLRRLDHILYTAELRVRGRCVVRSRAAKRASDHYPLWAEFEAAGRVDAMD